MALVKLDFIPGIDKENTRYSSKSTWITCDKIRFVQGFPEKIGGWTVSGILTYQGVARHLNNWITLTNRNLMAVGTNLKFYIEYGEAYSDITPIRTTIISGVNPFTTSVASTTVTANIVSHGAITGDFVTFTNAVGFNGLTAAQLNLEFQVTMIDANNFSFIVSSAATGAGLGGGTVTGAFQINTTAATAITGDGWGTGGWGRGTWGSAFTTIITIGLRTWSSSNFGQDLIFVPRNGNIYYWTGAGVTFNRAVTLKSLSADAETPVVGNGVLVGDDRSVIIFGANPLGSTVQDPLLVRWSASEQPLVWTPAATNSAGSSRLNTGTEIVTQLKTKEAILIWTNSALFSMQYVGTPVIYSTLPIAENISIAGPNAAVTANNITYWMGRDKFYIYTGRVETLPCSVRSYVFTDFNTAQSAQAFAGTIEKFNEIYWFYCSLSSTTVNRYVSYNYIDNVWATGTMTRSAWTDTKNRAYPYAAGYDNKLYLHESGIDDGSTSPATAIPAFIESSDFDIDEGNQYAFVQRVIPDVNFAQSTAAAPQVIMTVKTSNFPGQAFNAGDARTVSRTSTVPVDQYTNQVWVRIRGREMSLRIESTDAGVTWRSGAHRIDYKPDGFR